MKTTIKIILVFRSFQNRRMKTTKIRVFKIDYFILPPFLVAKLRPLAQNERKKTPIDIFSTLGTKIAFRATTRVAIFYFVIVRLLWPSRKTVTGCSAITHLANQILLFFQHPRPITISSHVFTNSVTTNLRILFTKFSLLSI